MRSYLRFSLFILIVASAFHALLAPRSFTTNFEQLVKVIFIMFGLFLPLVAFFCLVLFPPIERFLDRILPSWFKTIFWSIAQAGLLTLLTFALLGIFATSGEALMRLHPTLAFGVGGILAIFFSIVNFKTGEYKD